MGWKSAGRSVLRWGLWLLFGWVFVRGIVSFLPAPAADAAAEPQKEHLAQVEPAGLRAVPEMFAREYLSWSAGGAEERAGRIRSYLAPTLNRQAGWSPAEDDAGQEVVQTWVYGVKPVSETRWQVTVAARVIPYRHTVAVVKEGETETRQTLREALPARTIFLAVPVGRTEGGWVVYDYPSLLPPPAPAAFAEPLYYGQEVSDEGGRAKALLTDFFKAYLNGGDVTYYLSPDTQVRTIAGGGTFEQVADLTLLQTEEGRWALADVAVRDPASGARFTYRYTVKLADRDGRWYIADLLQKGD